jgi:hypothetical protein
MAKPLLTITSVRERIAAGAPLSRADLALYLSVTVRTVDRMIEAGTLPQPDLRYSQRLHRWSARAIRPFLAATTESRETAVAS